MRTSRPLLVGCFALLGLAAAAAADTEVRRVTGGISSLTLYDGGLQTLGLSVERIRATTDDDALDATIRSGERSSFTLRDGNGATFRIRAGTFAGFEAGSVRLSYDGGVVFRAGSGTTIPMLDFRVDVVADDAVWADVVPQDGGALFEIRGVEIAFDATTDRLLVYGGDLVVSPAGARRLGRPELAGEWVGTADFRLESSLVRREQQADPVRPVAPADPIIDVTLREVYGLDDLGRIGTYPNGTLGLSFYTTSCNAGNVDVPWHAPMAEDHPFIGLGMFRTMNGRMEMIGKSWVKHGFYALANNQCGLGCAGGSGGGYLYVGCSDTYSISNNGSQYYLAPREEVNPHTCVWECTGSWFDGIPVDCVRSEDGLGLNPVEHRMQVYENDLAIPGATYYYEGVYWVMNDVDLVNNYGWRQCTGTWTGSGWTFSDVGGGLLANPGPVISQWGDEQHSIQVAPGDGFVILADQVTDLGGGTWHYEYALYNQTSDRGVQKFSIPVGAANLTNVGFRDIDRTTTNDWTFAVNGGLASWTTIPYGSAGESYPLTYQTLFNFWFDADAAPQSASARLELYKPGPVSVAFVASRGPYGSGTSVPDVVPSRDELTLLPVEPNPFAGTARITYALPGAHAARLLVTDVTGRTVRTLLQGVAAPGRASVVWDGRDDTGSEVASGIYFFRLESAGRARTVKGTLLR